MTERVRVAWLGPAVAAAVACSGASGDSAPDLPGAPLARLTETDLAAFTAGRTLFHHEFTPEQGLGPLFNERRCSSCHDLPTLGGTGGEIVQKVSRWSAGVCDMLRHAGGDVLQQQVTDTLRALGFGAELIPREATAVVSMIAPALYGLGLVEAIPEEALLARADPDDADGDGIAGRPGRTPDGRVGRFGTKAGFATLRSFIENALLVEMGLTTAGHPEEERPGGRPLPPGVDPAPDPELNAEAVDLLTRFVQLLAPPEPVLPASRSARDSLRQGMRIFDDIGCAECHTPAFRTRSDVPALHDREVRLYSDLLLHDLGAERASVCAPHAGPSQWRTPPLMGLRHRHHLLHDGHAQSVRSAIEAHGGEAARSRERFLRLRPVQQDLLLRFLHSL